MSKEAMKLALEALDGEHVDRAYGYIQEALDKGEEHMTNQPETKPLINFDLAEEVPGHVGFLNVCITNDSTGGNSEETYLTLNTEDLAVAVYT
jgi:hypothetical protein